jgi:cytochrome b
MKITTVQPEINNQARVWDIGVRIFHWSLVSMFSIAYIFADQRWLHLIVGYAVLALVAFRLVWGFIGSKHARFSDFVPGPVRLLRYLKAMATGREERTLGHNPAGGAMIVTLLLTLTGIGVTGYMIGMDAYFGVEWVERTHKLLVNLSLALVVLHVSGVIFSSIRHRENLVKSMFTGKKETEHRSSIHFDITWCRYTWARSKSCPYQRTYGSCGKHCEGAPKGDTQRRPPNICTAYVSTSSTQQTKANQ